MTHASNDNGNGYYFKNDVIAEIEYMFGAMMRGENMTSELQPYLPLTVDTNYWFVEFNYAEWRTSFESTLDTSQAARKGETH